MKKKVCSILLTIAVLFTAADFPMLAGAAEENGAAGEYSGTMEETGEIPETPEIVEKTRETSETPAENRVTVAVIQDAVQDDAEKITAGKTQSAHVAAKNIGDSDAVLRVYLTNADGTAPDMEIEVPNLCTEDVNLQSKGDDITEEDITRSTIAETMKGALILADGSTADLTAEWKETRDDNNTVTEHFLEAALPAGASTRFDMQLLYRTDEEIYTRTTLVRAKAFVDGQEVTEASDEEDEDNEAEFTWKAAAEAGGESEAEDETGEETTEGTGEGTTGEAEETTGKEEEEESGTETEGVTAKRVMRAANGVAALADYGESGQTIYYRKNIINHDIWDNATQIYIYGIYEDDTNSEIQPMEKSTYPDLTDGWQYTFEKPVKTIIFLVNSDFGNDAAQTVDIFVGGNAKNYCYYVVGNEGYKKTVAYEILRSISYAGETLNFVDLTSKSDLTNVSAIFQTDNGDK